MVNSEILVGTTKCLTLYTRCRINRCRYNRFECIYNGLTPNFLSTPASP
jgi:hypothetical protein